MAPEWVNLEEVYSILHGMREEIGNEINRLEDEEHTAAKIYALSDRYEVIGDVVSALVQHEWVFTDD